jgi:hypothetical protein
LSSSPSRVWEFWLDLLVQSVGGHVIVLLMDDEKNAQFVEYIINQYNRGSNSAGLTSTSSLSDFSLCVTTAIRDNMDFHHDLMLLMAICIAKGFVCEVATLFWLQNRYLLHSSNDGSKMIITQAIIAMMDEMITYIESEGYEDPHMELRRANKQKVFVHALRVLSSVLHHS